MEENKKSPQFIPVEIDDLIPHFTSDEGSRKVKIWAEQENVLTCYVVKAQKKHGLLFDFKLHDNKTFPLEWNSRESLLIHFKIEGVEYFGKVSVLSVEGTLLKVCLEENPYRCERRFEKRVILFPQYTSYIVYKRILRPNGKKSLTSFNGSESYKIVDKDFFFPKDDIMTMRVYDLSKKGISFFLSEEQLKIFSIKHRETKTLNILLRVDETVFFLRDSLVIYVEKSEELSNAKKIVLKMGVTFPENVELNKKIQEILEGKKVKETIQANFENFIKKIK